MSRPYPVDAARVALALPFVGVPIAYFLHLGDPPHTGGALALLEAMTASGYLLSLVKGAELVVGVALLVNRFVPLALAVLAPLMLNILAFHLFLEPHTSLFPLLLASLHGYLAYAYRDAFAPLLAARAAPAGRRTRRGPHTPSAMRESDHAAG